MRIRGYGRLRWAFSLAWVGAALLAAGVADAQTKPVTVTVTRAKDIHTSGEGFDVGSNPPDWYVKVTINGVTLPFSSVYDDQGDVSPRDWIFTVNVPADQATVPVSIQLWDEDSPFDPNGDDLADISPLPNDRNLDFTVDMTNGKWTGDVVWPKSCSQGGPGDDTAMLCFDVSVLSPSGDADGDGLLDGWEANGMDVDQDGTVDVDLPALGANPFHQDVFLEVDWMDCTVGGSDCAPGDNHNHKPTAAAKQAVINAFAAAPRPNPDGTSGINLHIDDGQSIPHRQYVILPNSGCVKSPAAGDGSFDAIKAANFNPSRRFAFHYVVFGHLQDPSTTSSGCAELPGNDVLVTLVGTNDQKQAGTLMHELGHNLNLQHGGADSINYKPNYLSVMNYTWQLGGLQPTDPDGPGGPLTGRLDYSNGNLKPLNENDLVEINGMGTPTDNVAYFCPNNYSTGCAGDGSATTVTAASVASGVDWNCDGGISYADQTLDVNGDYSDADADGCFTPGDTPSRGTLNDNNDWANILLAFQGTPSFADGVRDPMPASELDESTYDRLLAPELKISKTASPDPVLTGSDLAYTIRVGSTGVSAASSVTVTDHLPSSLAFKSCSTTGTGTCGGSGNDRTVTFPSMGGATSETVTLTGTVSCDLSDGATISNTATVATADHEIDPSDDSATASVKASNPPPVISDVSASLPSLWPPNHKLVDETIAYKVTDNCPGTTCSLSVTSNEPIDGTGDGDTAPDWVIVDDHHVQLRAERSGDGHGRIYTVIVRCGDSGGASASASATVTVPHDGNTRQKPNAAARGSRPASRQPAAKLAPR